MIIFIDHTAIFIFYICYVKNCICSIELTVINMIDHRWIFSVMLFVSRYLERLKQCTGIDIIRYNSKKKHWWASLNKCESNVTYFQRLIKEMLKIKTNHKFLLKSYSSLSRSVGIRFFTSLNRKTFLEGYGSRHKKQPAQQRPTNSK